ncbi:MAG TPA: CDP-alcohol phosphatidyltransferase family protein [Candidatus Paceibacterota bacterium]|nr:CDP-alcohol phosphatidyltransferase family protein [Candidatus Paceibacterota bacterium]
MTKITLTDKILDRTVLPFIPKWITPNAVTCFRFATIPFVCYLFASEQYNYGLILFLISAFSDALDGSMARTRNQITEWGKMFDPLADKLLIGVSVFILVSKFLNPYLAATIILIEFFIITSAYYRKHAHGVPIEAELSGKIKMVLESLGMISILFGVILGMGQFFIIAYYLVYLAIVFAIISLVVYKSI